MSVRLYSCKMPNTDSLRIFPLCSSSYSSILRAKIFFDLVGSGSSAIEGGKYLLCVIINTSDKIINKINKTTKNNQSFPRIGLNITWTIFLVLNEHTNKRGKSWFRKIINDWKMSEKEENLWICKCIDRNANGNIMILAQAQKMDIKNEICLQSGC